MPSLTAGQAGKVNLAGEAIRLAGQLTLAAEEPEARGLLALSLISSLVSSDQWAARSHQPVGNRETL